MRPKDIRAVLDSMTVLVDTREQDTERARWRYAAIGLPAVRCTLDYGDYSYNAILPDGQDIYDVAGRISPKCVIERKMNLDELAECFGRGRERFVREFERASGSRASMWLLVEGASWENIYDHRYRSMMNPEALASSVIAFAARYGVRPIFCTERMTGRVIRSILRRDLEDRLRAGEYG